MNETVQKKTILVVDDTPENIQVLIAVLGDKYKVKVAKDGEKALKIANASKPPDLILLDILMPDMDGYEVCRRLKENDTTKDIPVIFVTGTEDSNDQQKGIDLGAFCIITKPVNPSVMHANIKQALGISQ